MSRARRNCRTNGNGNGNGNGSVWNAGTAVNVFGIPLITVVFGLGGFYLLTKDTLQRHEEAITTQIPTEFKEEAKARESNHTEFIDKLGKINDSIGTLNTHAAVQDQADKQIADTLERISRQLEAGALKPSGGR